MFMIAIKSKNFYDSEFANSEAAKGWRDNGHGWMTLKDKSEGELKTLASRIWLHYSLESRVFEI